MVTMLAWGCIPASINGWINSKAMCRAFVLCCQLITYTKPDSLKCKCAVRVRIWCAIWYDQLTFIIKSLLILARKFGWFATQGSINAAWGFLQYILNCCELWSNFVAIIFQSLVDRVSTLEIIGGRHSSMHLRNVTYTNANSSGYQDV